MSTLPIAFFGTTYEEALNLLEESRTYLVAVEPIDRSRLSTFERLRLCSETMRLIARLVQIMAWLLTQRAVQEGEMTRQQALADRAGLGDIAICMEHAEGDWTDLPRRLVALLDRSHRLYLRVARLDALARGEAA